MKKIINLFVMAALLMAGFRSFAQNNHEYVDLGLPSGTLWATCNVGANSPEEYGNYYAWGETQPKTIYNWDTYKYCENGNDRQLTKYCIDRNYGKNRFTDKLTELQADDDPATSWGSGWCMPTKEQWEELLQNTTNKWSKQNGVYGWLFTAKNGLALFLPAATNADPMCRKYAGYHGYYWSRSLDIYDPPYAQYLYFMAGSCYMARSIRNNGFSVRPVLLLNDNDKEDAAYKQCTTISGCVSYLKIYPQGRYVTEVKAKKVELEEHAYVDLGLPSGTLWATCNVGANSPEEYGDYFAWGETQPKTTYSKTTYSFTDNQTVLQSSDDAATANRGLGWCMPTKEQWDELLQNTTNKWTTQNGVQGRLFTAKNGQMLFLPAAGYRSDSKLINDCSNGYYWSSSLYTDNPGNAWDLYFEVGKNCYLYYFNFRNRGYSVRPVRQN
jgi:hypothetical protein